MPGALSSWESEKEASVKLAAPADPERPPRASRAPRFCLGAAASHPRTPHARWPGERGLASGRLREPPHVGGTGTCPGRGLQSEAQTRALSASRAVALPETEGGRDARASERASGTLGATPRARRGSGRNSPPTPRRVVRVRVPRSCTPPGPATPARSRGAPQGGGRCHGTRRAAHSPGELVFPRGHVTGLAALGPGRGEGEVASRRPGGGRLARCVLRSCAGAFLSWERAEGRGRGHRSAFFFSQC